MWLESLNPPIRGSIAVIGYEESSKTSTGWRLNPPIRGSIGRILKKKQKK